MNGGGRFAVVIPAFNAARTLGQTLDSVLASGTGLAATIVVDDGSTDATPAVAGGRSGVELVSQANGGVSRARNAGLDRVAAEYVCFLDADDLVRPGALDLLLHRLRTSPDAVAAFGKVGYVDRDSRPVPGRSRVLPRRLDLVDVLEANFIDTPGAILFRTEAVRRAGGFVPGLAMGEDWELYVRVALLGAIVSVPDTVLDYRLHASSAMRRASLSPAAFEPALRCVFAAPARYAGRVDPAALRRCELRKRAGHLHTMSRGPAPVGRGLRMAAAGARLVVRARFDRRVVALCVRAVLGAALGVVGRRRR